MTCPGCINSLVGHDKDCPVMSEQASGGPAHVDIDGARQRIRERIAEKRVLYEHYRAHARKMLDINDAHGSWDASVNMSEVSCAIDEAEACLAIVEGREP